MTEDPFTPEQREEAAEAQRELEAREQIVPSQEQLDEYVAKLEQEMMTPEERQIALQAQADLAEGKRLVEEQQAAKIKALLRTFKGIHSRRQIVTLASIGLRRFAAINDAEVERQRAEQDGD